MAPQIALDFHAAQAAHPSLMPFHPVVRRWFAERLGEPSRPQVEGWPLIQAGHDVLDRRAHRQRQDAHRLPRRAGWAVPAGAGRHAPGPDAGALRVAPQGAGQRRAEEPAAAARGAADPGARGGLLAPGAARAGAHRRHLRLRAGADDRAARRTSSSPRPSRSTSTSPPTAPAPRCARCTPSSWTRSTRWRATSAAATSRSPWSGSRRSRRCARSSSACPPRRSRWTRIAGFLTGASLAGVQARGGRPPAAVGADGGDSRRGAELASPRTRCGARSTTGWCSWPGQHRTTLIFVNTRKMAERVAHDLGERLGEDKVAAHHGSMSREIRLAAEEQPQERAARGDGGHRVAGAGHRRGQRGPGGAAGQHQGHLRAAAAGGPRRPL